MSRSSSKDVLPRRCTTHAPTFEMAGPVYTDLSTAIPDVVLPRELDDPLRKATSPLQTNTAIVTVTSPTNRSARQFPGAAPGRWRFPAPRGPSGRRSPVVRSERYTELRFIPLTPDHAPVPRPLPPHPFRTGRRHEISPAIVTVTNLKADPPPVKNPAAELRGGC